MKYLRILLILPFIIIACVFSSCSCTEIYNINIGSGDDYNLHVGGERYLSFNSNFAPVKNMYGIWNGYDNRVIVVFSISVSEFEADDETFLLASNFSLTASNSEMASQSDIQLKSWDAEYIAFISNSPTIYTFIDLANGIEKTRLTTGSPYNNWNINRNVTLETRYIIAVMKADFNQYKYPYLKYELKYNGQLASSVVDKTITAQELTEWSNKGYNFQMGSN